MREEPTSVTGAPDSSVTCTWTEFSRPAYAGSFSQPIATRNGPAAEMTWAEAGPMAPNVAHKLAPAAVTSNRRQRTLLTFRHRTMGRPPVGATTDGRGRVRPWAR